MDSNKRCDKPRALLLACLSLCCWAFSVSAARADDTVAVPSTANTAEVGAELAFIEDSFARQRLGAALWFSGWVGFNAANAGIAWWQYTASELRVEKDAWLMSAVGSSFCVAQSAIFPLPGLYGARRLGRWRADPRVTLQERHRRALALLEDAAEIEAANSGVLAHVAGLGFAVASSAYIYFRSMHADPVVLTTAVSLQFISTVIVVEATILSVPRRARRDLAALRAHRAGAPLPPASQRAERAPVLRDLRVAFGASQLGLSLRF